MFLHQGKEEEKQKSVKQRTQGEDEEIAARRQNSRLVTPIKIKTPGSEKSNYQRCRAIYDLLFPAHCKPPVFLPGEYEFL